MPSFGIPGAIHHFKDRWIRIILSTIVTMVFVFHATDHTRWRFISEMENLAYDIRLRASMPGGVDDRIVIIDIDEKSLAAEGRWPWPRIRIANLVDILFDHYQIGILGIDVVWAEPDVSSGLATLRTLAENELARNREFQAVLQEITPRLEYDEIFINSIKGRRIVLGYYFDTETEGSHTTGKLPAPVFKRDDFPDLNIYANPASGYGANLPGIQDAALDAGHFNPAIDEDGVVRKVPMLIEYKDRFYASLSLAMMRHLLGGVDVKPGFAHGTQGLGEYRGMEWLELGNLVIPVDENVESLIPFRGRKGSFPYISASDILAKSVAAEKLSGKIVLLGTSAQGLLDLRSTPVQVDFPGVEIHANLLAGFIDQDIPHSPAWSLGAEITQLVIIGLVMGITLPFLSPVLATLLTLTAITVIVYVNFHLWQDSLLALPVASSVLLAIGLYVLNMAYGFFIESRGKRQLAGLFGQYIPPEIVDEMSASPGAFSLAGDSREMSVMFSDVRDFTTISESLEPADLQQLMNEFLTPITRIIHQHRGTIDKYMGDAVMAFWGAPLADSQHARHAVETALAILKELETLNRDFVAKGWPALKTGIGINTGLMRVGDMGSEFRRAYTVMGDEVNLGSRLEGLTKYYGSAIIVSETTRDAAGDFVYRELDRVRVKGKDNAVTIYEPLCRVPASTELADELKLHDQALENYRNMKWDLAETLFLQLQKKDPESRLYRTYLERIQKHRTRPPEQPWDGVHVFNRK